MLLVAHILHCRLTFLILDHCTILRHSRELEVLLQIALNLTVQANRPVVVRLIRNSFLPPDRLARSEREALACQIVVDQGVTTGLCVFHLLHVPAPADRTVPLFIPLGVRKRKIIGFSTAIF